MSDAEVKFKFTPEPQKLMTALDDAEKKAKKAEGGIQSFLSSSTKESSGWSTALGGVTKAFGAITALVSAGKVLSFFGDAISEAEELEKKLEEVEAGSASLGESMESIDDRLTESLDGISSNISNRVGGFLLNIKKMVYATFANVAEAINSAFTIKDADKIEEHYEKQSKSLENIGDELTRLSAIQKRTAEEELQFLKIKEDMTIQLDKLGMSYTTLAQRTTSYKDAMAEAAREAKRQAQEQLWAQAQMLRQSAGMTADKFERGIALERLRASGDMRSPRARMMLREAAEDRVNDEKRIKLAKELEAKAINLGKPKPVAATGGGGPVTESQINEQRFIQSRNRLIQIENDRIDTIRKIKQGKDYEDLTAEQIRQIKNANKEAEVLQKNEFGNLRNIYASFIEDKATMDSVFIESQTNQAIKASEELFEARKKQSEQLHLIRLANGADEEQSEQIREKQIAKAKIDNEERLKKIRMESVKLQAKAALDSFNQTMQAATSLAKGATAFQRGDFAGGFSSVGAGIGGLGKGLSSLGVIEAGGKASQVFAGLGMAGQVLGIGTSLTSALGSLFGKSDEQRAREAQEQKARDEEAQRLLEIQANYQKNMLAIQEQAAKLPFENLQRKLRLTEITASQQRISGVDETTVENERLAARSSAIQETLVQQSGSIAGGQLFGDVKATPESLIKFLSERAAQSVAVGQFVQYASQLNSVLQSPMADYGSIIALMNVMDNYTNLVPPELFNAVMTSELRALKQTAQGNKNLGYQGFITKNIPGTALAPYFSAALSGLNAGSTLGSEISIDTGTAENLLSTIEQGNQVQLDIAANTKKTAQNTSLQMEKDRNAGFIDIAGGGIRGFGQLLAGNFGLNTNALTLPTGVSNAMLASQGMQSLEEKSYSALKDLVGVSENMRTLLGEIALNTNKMAGANVSGSKSEQDILTMLDNWESRS